VKFSSSPASQEFGSPHDLDALKSSEREQIEIARDEEGCSASKGASQDRIVIRVACHGSENSANRNQRVKGEAVG